MDDSGVQGKIRESKEKPSVKKGGLHSHWWLLKQWRAGVVMVHKDFLMHRA